MRLRALVFAACTAVTTGCSSTEPLALPTQPSDNTGAGRAPIAPSMEIAFMSQSGFDQSDLYVMRADGSGRRNILTVPGQAYEPDWSPDGDSLVFTWDAHPAGTSPFWIIRADGTGLRPVSNDDTYGYGARWSPDGKSFAFFHMVTEDIYDIGITKTDGSGLRLLVNGAIPVYGATVPAWSPDGRRIAFETSVDFNSAGIFVANVDGSDIHRLTTSADDFSARWSPDGSRLAYVQLSNAGPKFRLSLLVANGDGSNPVALTSDTRDYSPAWSPNGKTIAFMRLLGSAAPFHCSIFKIAAEGGTPTELTADLAMPGCAGVAWRPRQQGSSPQ